MKSCIDFDKVKIPGGWSQTSIACPMQYEKIIKKGGLHFVGYLRSRHEYPFSIEIFVTLNPKQWAGNSVLIGSIKPVDMFDDNPPLKSMALIDEIFKALVRLK